MPFLGLGLHILVALFFAVHAVRTGRQMYWLLILFSFPLLGSLVYFAAVFLPHSQIERQARLAGRALGRTLDPGREVREAQNDFDLTPTAYNQMRLAGALLDNGQSAEAVAQYDACLQGPFAADPEVIFGAARARLANRQPEAALALLAPLQAKQPGFRPEEMALALGGAYAGCGRQEEAGAQFETAVQKFGGIEGRVELALWALENGKRDLAERELKEIAHARKHMTKYTRGLHQGLFKRLDAATGGKRG
ncbi:MAG: hypothetical protein AB1807_18455 [Pseudomonadota bacterium]